MLVRSIFLRRNTCKAYLFKANTIRKILSKAHKTFLGYFSKCILLGHNSVLNLCRLIKQNKTVMLTLLIPTDFSDAAADASKFAIKLADQHRMNLVFFHEYHASRPPAMSGKEQKKLHDNTKEAHSERLVTHVKSLFIELNKEYRNDRVEFCLAESFNLTETVLEAASKYSADLIVTGTTGANSLGKKLFGSNTANLIAQSRVPILSVPAGFTADKLNYLAFATTLTHVGSELIRVMDIVKMLQAKIDLFFVYPNFPEHIDVSKLNPHILEKGWQEKFQHPHIKLYFIKTDGANESREGIQEFVRLYQPDALLMFTRERSLFDKIFNSSLTSDMASYLKLPILSFKD
ncbi:MAG: universal stress protein [Cytophagales bacterium]|nr:MAG: universal stress protein [Cytophagales bacterium]TAF61107.1 MAG: universal stress protein [Cytophagales bacterium]